MDLVNLHQVAVCKTNDPNFQSSAVDEQTHRVADDSLPVSNGYNWEQR